MESNEQKQDIAEQRDRRSGITGGLVLVLLGAMFLLSNLHLIPQGTWWAYFLLGLGCIFILDALVRALAERNKPWPRGKLVAGAVLIALGAHRIFGLVSWWPWVLIAVGLVIILSSFRKTE